MKLEEASLDPACPFCREPIPDTDEGFDEQMMKRVEAKIHLLCAARELRVTAKEIIELRLSITQGLLSWDMLRRTIDCQFCIKRGMVLRRIRERKRTIWKRLQLEVIPALDTILDVTSGTMIMLREQ